MKSRMCGSGAWRCNEIENIVSFLCSLVSERWPAHLVVPPTRALADPEPAPLVLLGDAILREVLGERFRQHDVTASGFVKMSAFLMY